jgi:hypothetical protein
LAAKKKKKKERKKEKKKGKQVLQDLPSDSFPPTDGSALISLKEPPCRNDANFY